jgi:hypothetical protein
VTGLACAHARAARAGDGPARHRAAAGLLDVKDLRHWSYPDYTRIVIELSGEFSLKGAPQKLPPAEGRPERLYLDLDGVWVGTRYAEGVPVGDGLLRGVRLGQNTERAVRVVLDLQNYSRHRVLVLAHPDRLVIDVYGSRRETRRGPTCPRSRHAARRASRRGCPPTCGSRRRSCSTRATAGTTRRDRRRRPAREGRHAAARARARAEARVRAASRW